jgi:hypothetical protein
MRDCPHVSSCARVSARWATPLLPPQQSCDALGGAGRVCTSTAPRARLAVVGSAPPLPVDGPLNRRLGVAPPPRATGARDDVPPPGFAAPVPRVAPLPALVRRATPAPRAPWVTPLFVPRRNRLVTPARRAGVAPAADHRVPRRAQACLCLQPLSAPHRPQVALMTCHRLPARGDAGLVAPRRRRGVGPHVEPHAGTPGLPGLDVPGGGDAGVARLHGHAPVASGFRQPRRTARDHCARGRQGHQILRSAQHGRSVSAGQRSRARLFPSVQGHVGGSGRYRAAWWCPGCGREPAAPVESATRPPRVALSAQGRRRVALAYPGVVVEASDALGEGRRPHPLRLLGDLDLERSTRLPGAPSWANARAVWCERGCPGRVNGWGDPPGLGAVCAGGHPQGPRLRRAGFGTGDPMHR